MVWIFPSGEERSSDCWSEWRRETTAAKILTTILKPFSDRAAVAGFDVVAHPLDVRRRVAAVLPESAVETMLSTWDNLVLYGKLHGYSSKEIATRSQEVLIVIDLLELQPVLDGARENMKRTNIRSLSLKV